MNYYDDLLKIDKIIAIPEPKFFWESKDEDSPNRVGSFYGYKSDLVRNGKPLYFGSWLIDNFTEEEKQKKLRQIIDDIRRTLLYNDDITKDSIIDPLIVITDKQWKQIRSLGKKVLED
jgi:hypothetical protein